nr:MAG TPA: hypothetical protein [Caudoviricetes sp.]
MVASEQEQQPKILPIHLYVKKVMLLVLLTMQRSNQQVLVLP